MLQIAALSSKKDALEDAAEASEPVFPELDEFMVFADEQIGEGATLFNSQKLYTALYQAETLAHGVSRTHGRGFPPLIIQLEVKNKNEAERLRGTTKAARLVNSTKCPDLLAVSVYDTKPVHLLSTAADCVEWKTLERKVWSTRESRKIMMKYLRLGMIDDYNNNMNSVDMADQLRGSYRPDRWMRNRKWWWSFLIWGIGVAGVNAYLIYESIYDEEAKKKKGYMPKRWSHIRFLEELAYDLLFPEATKQHLKTILETENASLASSVRMSRSVSVSGAQKKQTRAGSYDLTSVKGLEKYLDDVKPTRVNENLGTYFPHRLDGLMHARVPSKVVEYCQYCYYKRKKRGEKKNLINRKRISRCLVCNINLCEACENEFHDINLNSYRGYGS